MHKIKRKDNILYKPYKPSKKLTINKYRCYSIIILFQLYKYILNWPEFLSVQGKKFRNKPKILFPI